MAQCEASPKLSRKQLLRLVAGLAFRRHGPSWHPLDSWSETGASPGLRAIAAVAGCRQRCCNSSCPVPWS